MIPGFEGRRNLSDKISALYRSLVSRHQRVEQLGKTFLRVLLDAFLCHDGEGVAMLSVLLY